MSKIACRSIAILGAGWSGSGALIDLFKKQSRVSCYPYELDFWRRPNGLSGLETRSEVFFFCVNETFLAIKIMVKACIKLLVNPRAIKTNLATIFTQVKMTVLMLVLLISLLSTSDVRNKRKFFMRRFQSLFRRKGTFFIYDQAVFLEQVVEESNLGDLDVGACIFVLRDVFDQVQDFLNNSAYLKAQTIRESFFLGALGDFGSDPNSLQLNLMLLTLQNRIRKIRELVTTYPDSFLIVKFEDLVEDTDLVISNVNRFLELKGFPSAFIDCNGADKVFCNSRKSIGIGKQTQWTHVSLMEEINDDVRFLVSKLG